MAHVTVCVMVTSSHVERECLFCLVDDAMVPMVHICLCINLSRSSFIVSGFLSFSLVYFLAVSIALAMFFSEILDAPAALMM